MTRVCSVHLSDSAALATLHSSILAVHSLVRVAPRCCSTRTTQHVGGKTHVLREHSLNGPRAARCETTCPGPLNPRMQFGRIHWSGEPEPLTGYQP